MARAGQLMALVRRGGGACWMYLARSIRDGGRRSGALALGLAQWAAPRLEQGRIRLVVVLGHGRAALGRLVLRSGALVQHGGDRLVRQLRAPVRQTALAAGWAVRHLVAGAKSTVALLLQGAAASGVYLVHLVVRARGAAKGVATEVWIVLVGLGRQGASVLGAVGRGVIGGARAVGHVVLLGWISLVGLVRLVALVLSAVARRLRRRVQPLVWLSAWIRAGLSTWHQRRVEGRAGKRDAREHQRALERAERAERRGRYEPALVPVPVSLWVTAVISLAMVIGGITVLAGRDTTVRGTWATAEVDHAVEEGVLVRYLVLDGKRLTVEVPPDVRDGRLLEVTKRKGSWRLGQRPERPLVDTAQLMGLLAGALGAVGLFASGLSAWDRHQDGRDHQDRRDDKRAARAAREDEAENDQGRNGGDGGGVHEEPEPGPGPDGPDEPDGPRRGWWRRGPKRDLDPDLGADRWRRRTPVPA